jgi:hypothetical protein
MAVTPDKRALREAAEKIERAVDAYGAGDLAGSSRLFEEALTLMPEHQRAQLYLGWVRDLSTGKKKLGGIDEETLQAIADTLAPEEEQTQEKRSIEMEAESAGAGEESPWDPVPLTPAGQRGEAQAQAAPPAIAPPEPAPPAVVPPAPLSSAPPIERTRKKSQPPGPSPVEGRVKPPSSTLMGMSPADQPSLLTPARPKGLYDSTENTNSVTREWKTTPTASNLPLLDVPELTDEQIQELLALDGSPMVLEVSPPTPQAPRPETPTDQGLGEPEERMLEMVAEPTPEPHLNPLGPTHVPLLSLDGDATQPRGSARRRDSTTPDADVRSFQSGEFDTLEQTPTRERRDLLRAVVEAAQEPNGPGSDEDLELLPLEAPQRDDILGEGTNPTNPFIKRRLAEYSYGTGSLPKVEDLPPAPGLNDTNRQPVVNTLQTIQDPLDRGDISAALEAAEKFLSEHGGLNADTVQPHYWLFERVYECSVGSLQTVPKHGQAVRDLDPRSAFLLSRLDGMSSVEDLLDISGMPRLEALRVLALLVRRGVVTVK